MGFRDELAKWIDTTILLTGAVPGITGAILAVIAMMPKAVQQEYTEEKVRGIVTAFRERQQHRLDEFNARRTEEFPDEEEAPAEEDPNS